MFYYLSQFQDAFSFLNIFRYITFRSSMAAVTTFLLCVVFGPYFIRKLKELKCREIAKRDDCPDLDKFMNSKQGTPTMGGVFIIGSIVIASALWADLTNPYVRLTLFAGVWMAVLGWLDDYTKLTKKGPHRGLRGRIKLLWQLVAAFIIGAFIYVNPSTSTQLDVPFLKSALVDLGVAYVFFVAIIIVGTSNAVNLTDGLDGLAIGCVLITSIALSLFCYITGHVQFSDYLFIPYVPGAGELTVIGAAIMGASLGFLWFNCYPASVFMGDVGSLSLGGMLGVMAIIVKKELLLVILGGVFVLEAMSVILQVASFKTTGKRIFKMSPFHHHLQMSGWPESKIIIRFWITAIVLALITLTTLKIR